MDIALVVTDLLILALSVAPIYGASMYSVRYIKVHSVPNCIALFFVRPLSESAWRGLGRF